MDLIGLFSGGAALFRGLTGFGYALTATVVLTGLLLPRVLVPFVLVNDLVLTLLTLGDWRKSPPDRSVSSMLVVTGIIGAPLGSVLAGVLDPAKAQLTVSIVVTIAAIVALLPRPPRWLAARPFGIAIGLLVGVMLGAFAVGGPLIAAWLLAGGTEARRVRGTLAVYFGVVDALSLTSRALMGELGAEFSLMLAYAALPTLAGFGGGLLLSRRLSPETWRRIAASGLTLIAIAGLIQALRALISS